MHKVIHDMIPSQVNVETDAAIFGFCGIDSLLSYFVVSLELFPIAFLNRSADYMCTHSSTTDDIDYRRQQGFVRDKVQLYVRT